MLNMIFKAKLKKDNKEISGSGYVYLREEDAHYIFTGRKNLVYGSGNCWDLFERHEIDPNTLTVSFNPWIDEGDIML